jgi:hypothetical protein
MPLTDVDADGKSDLGVWRPTNGKLVRPTLVADLQRRHGVAVSVGAATPRLKPTSRPSS